MPESQGTLREIVWRDVFPWLILLRAPRVAMQTPMLLLGTAGALLTIFGWWGIAGLFSGTKDSELKSWTAAYRSCPWRAAARPVGTFAPTSFDTSAGVAEFREDGTLVEPPAWQNAPRMGALPVEPWASAWLQLSAPWLQIFRPGLTVPRLAFLLLCGLWVVAVWALFGGAIARSAAMQMAREEKIGLSQSLRFAVRKWSSFCGGPLFPMLGVTMVIVPMWAVGLLMRADFMAAIASAAAWPLMLLASMLIVILLLGVLFGWPLMWPAIATENSDSFDALSRSYSYVFQRPFHYLWYAIVAAALGGLATLIVHGVVETVVYLPRWAASASFSAGEDRMAELAGDAAAAAPGAMFTSARTMIWFWSGCVRAVALGFVFAYFWTAASAIYLLLRFEVDGAEMDEIHVDSSGETYGLPTLETDAQGVKIAPREEAAAAGESPRDVSRGSDQLAP